jgi:hypothetical protein
MNIKIPG